MAKVTATLTQIPMFYCDIRGGSHNSNRWNTWLKQFEIYLIATNVTDETIKINTFLHVAGPDIINIYGVVCNAQETALKDVITKISAHLSPKVDVRNEILKFRSMAQHYGEGIDSYYVRLKEQAKICNFTNADLEIALQIINGCISNKIKIKAKQENLALEDMLKYARLIEDSAFSNTPSTTSTATTANIKQEQANKIFNQHSNRQTNKNTTCGLCGGQYPHKGICPARGKECHKCNKLNHFAKCCRSSNNKQGQTYQKNNQYHHQQPQIKKYQQQQHPNKYHQNQKVHQITSNEDQHNYQPDHQHEHEHEHEYQQDNYNDKYNHHQVSQVVNNNNNSLMRGETTSSNNNSGYTAFSINDRSLSCPRIDIQIGNNYVNVGIDTQATINVMSYKTYMNLKDKPALMFDNSITYGIDSPKPIPSKGKFKAIIYANNRQHETEIFVFDNVRDNLLSFKSSINLGLINLTYSAENETANDSFHKMIISRYPELFSGKVGLLKDFEAKLHINNNIKPIQQAPRRIPFHLRPKVEMELAMMENEGLIEDCIGPTPWISEMVTVPKPHNANELRIVIDARAPNTAIEREISYTPTIDDLAIDLNNARILSKLDLKSGYHQIKLAEESRYITAFRTPKGTKQYARLTQGIKSSSDIFQKAITRAIDGLQGAINIADDIFVWGSTYEEHDLRLTALLDRLLEKGLTLNPKKCILRKNSLEFFGLQFSSNGISITESKIKALRDAERPKTQSELRSFLGLANYCSRSIPNLAQKSDLLWQLTRPKQKFIWTADHHYQFNDVKYSIIDKALAYFNKNWITSLEVDASPTGAAAVLYQTNPEDDDDKRIVMFWSQLFTDVERRYSQCEKEALAIVMACEKFRLYLLGKRFNLITDNKAVELILKNPNSKPPARIERWNLRLMEYDFDIQHKPGAQNVADYLSRNAIYDNKQQNKLNVSTILAEQHVHYIEYDLKPQALSFEEILNATKNDKILQKVIKSIQTNQFDNTIELKPFKNIQDELSTTSNGIVLRGNRIIIPSTLRLKTIQLAHEGHQGITKNQKTNSFASLVP